jgi:hypothetical protein
VLIETKGLVTTPVSAAVRAQSTIRMTSHFGSCCAIGNATVQSAVAEVEHLGPDRPDRVEGRKLERKTHVRAVLSSSAWSGTKEGELRHSRTRFSPADGLPMRKWH